MHGLVALDKSRRPLRPAILWNDGRTQAQCDEIEQRVGLARLLELTGNRALAGFTAPKLLWMRENEPDLYARIEHVLLPKDYVRLRLHRRARDRRRRRLGHAAVRRRGARVEPRGDERAGHRPGRGCRACTSPRRPPGVTHGDVLVAAGGGDQAAGALGVGVVAEGGPA